MRSEKTSKWMNSDAEIQNYPQVKLDNFRNMCKNLASTIDVIEAVRHSRNSNWVLNLEQE